MARKYLVPCQPRRDEERSFRTHITRPNSLYDIRHPDNILMQVLLYRACRAGELVSGASISDIHEFISFDHPHLSKKRMGDVIVNATIYNPRVLKGVTKINDKARMLYVWDDMRDLEYGIEWQMAMWLFKLERDAKDRTEERFEEFFEEIATKPISDVIDSYVTPGSQTDKINWPEVWEKHQLTRQDYVHPDWEKQPDEKRPRLQSRL